MFDLEPLLIIERRLTMGLLSNVNGGGIEVVVLLAPMTT
jgi:hypothetical protein